MFSVSGLLRKKAERAKCAAQMRTLAVALGAYTQENKQWPQPPMSSLGSNEEKFWRWWFEVFEQPPYGIKRETWVCPTVLRESGITKTEDITKGSYLPTFFDANPRTPYQWGNQPWLVEVGSHEHAVKQGGSVTKLAGFADN